MGWQVNNLPLIGILEGLLEGIGDLCNTNGEVVSGINGKNQPECR